MGVLPTGTVTLLFTDIEGSTRMWEHEPEATAKVVERHDRVLRGVIEGCGGYVFKTVGDAFCAAFAASRDAVQAAAAAQVALCEQDWPEGLSLRVRMAINTGECEEREGDYFGPVVNRVARLQDTTFGGQILLTHTSADLVGNRLPPGLKLVDLGPRPLKDFDTPEHVFQLEVVDADLVSGASSLSPIPPRAPTTGRRKWVLAGGGIAACLLALIIFLLLQHGPIGRTLAITDWTFNRSGDGLVIVVSGTSTGPITGIYAVARPEDRALESWLVSRQVRPNAAGRWSATIDVPSNVSGPYTVQAVEMSQPSACTSCSGEPGSTTSVSRPSPSGSSTSVLAPAPAPSPTPGDPLVRILAESGPSRFKPASKVIVISAPRRSTLELRGRHRHRHRPRRMSSGWRQF